MVEQLDDGSRGRRSEGRLTDGQPSETHRVGAVDVLVGRDVADQAGRGNSLGQGSLQDDAVHVGVVAELRQMLGDLLFGGRFAEVDQAALDAGLRGRGGDGTYVPQGRFVMGGHHDGEGDLDPVAVPPGGHR